jgi:putative membrane protein
MHDEGREMIRKSIALAALLFVGLGPVAAGAAPKAEPAADAGFLQAVHQADMAEIAAGGIAQERGVSARVRALGARFVRDHQAIDARLTATARAAGVTLPDTPSAAQLDLTKKYQSVPAAKFDALYLRTQLTAHNEAMRAGKTELAKGADARVKALVAYAAPIVKAHDDALVAALAGYGGSARHH